MKKQFQLTTTAFDIGFPPVRCEKEPPMTPPAVRVVIASDIRLYREGVAAILERDGHLDVVRTTAGSECALNAVGETRAHVLLLDVGMPDAVATVREISMRYPAVKTVALGVSENHEDVIACAEAGVTGYVFRDSSVDDLVAVVQSAEAGELKCSGRLAAILLQRVTALAARGAGEEPVHLTSREIEIAGLIEQGLTNKEIASRLTIQLSTAKNHVHRILDKLETHTRGEAVARLRRLGFFRAKRPSAAAPGNYSGVPLLHFEAKA
jgi:DNA-binding NarL/FixJ family response regulator